MALHPLLPNLPGAFLDQVPCAIDVYPLRPLRPNCEAQTNHPVQHRLRDEDLFVLCRHAQVERAVQIVLRRKALRAVWGHGGRQLQAEDRQCERGSRDELEVG